MQPAVTKTDKNRYCDARFRYVRAFWPLKVLDVLLLLAASLIIGFIHGTGWSLSSVPTNAVMAMTCLGVLSMVTHLRTFSQV